MKMLMDTATGKVASEGEWILRLNTMTDEQLGIDDWDKFKLVPVEPNGNGGWERPKK